MIKTPCPYCKNPEMPEPPKNARPYGKCPKCGKKSRAAIYWDSDGRRFVKYVATSYAKPKELVKRVFSIRLNQSEIKSLQNGKSILTISNNRLQLQYKS